MAVVAVELEIRGRQVAKPVPTSTPQLADTTLRLGGRAWVLVVSRPTDEGESQVFVMDKPLQ